MIVLIIGLPGSGKTTLASHLAVWLGAVQVNGDLVRADLSSDLSFSHEHRIEQARRIGAVSRLIADQGNNVVADFVCPTRETRGAFGDADVLVWMNRLDNQLYDDTSRMWQPPLNPDVVIRDGMTINEEVARVLEAC